METFLSLEERNTAPVRRQSTKLTRRSEEDVKSAFEKSQEMKTVSVITASERSAEENETDSKREERIMTEERSSAAYDVPFSSISSASESEDKASLRSISGNVSPSAHR